MINKYFILTIMLIIPIQVMASEKIYIDAASDRITINSGFDGSELVVYGTKKGGDIAIIVRGQDSKVLVRKKNRILRMWVNTQSISFNKVPLYYDYAVSKDEEKIADIKLLRELGIGVNAMNYSTIETDSKKSDIFHESLIRIQQTEGLLPLNSNNIHFVNPEFFKVNFMLPSNVPIGDYIIEAYLFKDGKLIDKARKDFPVLQIGIGGKINIWAKESSWLYGIGVVIFAVFMGWFSNFAFRRN